MLFSDIRALKSQSPFSIMRCMMLPLQRRIMGSAPKVKSGARKGMWHGQEPLQYIGKASGGGGGGGGRGTGGHSSSRL